MALVLDGSAGISGVDGTASNPAIEGTDSNTGIFYPAADTVAIGTGGTERLRVDSAGNVGEGVTPAAWASGIKALQVGANSYASTVDLNNGVTVWGSNYYNDGGNKFANASSRYALQILQDTTSGAQSWRVSNAAGTAGNAVTFTTAMTLDASGNFGLGTTALNSYANTTTFTIGNSVNAARIDFKSGSTTTAYVSSDSGSALYFGTGTTERARITGGGNLLVGSTTDDARLRVNGTAVIGRFVADGAGYTSTVLAVDTSGTASGTGFTLMALAAGGANQFVVRGDGRVTCAGIYNTTVGATNRDVFVDNGGVVGYVASIREAKINIQDLTDTSWLHQLNPVTFNYRKKDEEGNYTDETDGDIQYGMIAEDVEQVRPDLCFYDEVDGQQELRGIQYSKLVPVMLKEIQKLRAEIEALKGAA